MDYKMEVNRLTKEELGYELRVRGISVTKTSDLDGMRKTYRQLIRFENNPSYVKPAYPFTFAEYIKYAQDKINEIRTLINSFDGSATSAEYKKITTKLAHTLGRINRANGTTAADNNQKSETIISLLSLESELDSKLKESSKQSATLLDVSTLYSEPVSSDSNSENLNSDSDSESIDKSIKPVPASKWGLKFSGNFKDMFLSAFLERVKELRRARNISKKHLFSAAIDLLQDKALIWYRANRKQFSNWDELVQGLREEFQPVDYDDKLFEEIKHRTQGPTESIGIYISIMITLFSRLSVKVSEQTQLKILLRNISPGYQTPLSFVDVKSVAHLLKLCKQLEARKAAAEAFVPPPRRQTALEPDLAYVYAEPSTSCASVEQNPRTCWNCGISGHLAVNCRQPRKLHCYRCGAPGVTTKNCQKCSGNGRKTR